MAGRKQRTFKKKVNQPVKQIDKKVADFIKPMLAKETDTPFDDKNWIFEIKWDGYRAISEVKKDAIELYSRNGNSFNTTYPVVYNELKKIKHEVVLDGEIVIINEEGKSDFQKLQHYEDNTQYPICYYVFDILMLNGINTKELPLIERKELLEKVIPKSSVIKYSEHIIGSGIDFFKAAKSNDLEGIMAKKASSEYNTGTRTNDWLKIKHHKSEEVVIVGFTKPTGSRSYFGALVLAVKDENGFRYAGHTGSGFTDKMLKEVYDKLSPFIIETSPFKEKVKTNMPVTWVKPKFVCEIKFTEWTSDGKMRHPIFLQMREEKSINDIVMATKKNATKKKEIDEEVSVNEKELIIGKAKVKLTNLNKIYFPDDAITKGMVVDYYQQMSGHILPYLKDRPESLKRNPNGINDNGFFHKDAGDDAPSYIKSFKIFSESADKEIDYIICNDKATLAYMNNLGCIEINPWNSTTKSLDKPDYMIIDIDPSDNNDFEQVIETALAFKKLLDKAGATSFCKTSGATGLHIYVPMGKKYLYENVKDFAHSLCMLINEELPEFTSLERNLAKRGNNHIYLDYLQNRRGQTIACAYSLRPKIGGTISTPLLWEEVKAGLHPSQFNIKTVPNRINKLGDIFKGVLGTGVDIKKCIEKLS